MHRRMIERGLEGTELLVRDGRNGKKAAGRRKVSGRKLAELVKYLSEIERIAAVVARRGINFAEFLQVHYNGKKVPTFRVRVEGQDEIYGNRQAYEQRLDELKKAAGEDEADGTEQVIGEELHELARINEINSELRSQFELDLKDFAAKVVRMDSGQAATKFQLINNTDTYEVAGLGDICPAIRQIGGKGIEIKRFKGLGEMNAEQLWDTTMNPGKRMLLNVKVEDAGEADRLFSILMGGDVEKRRNFIREHALEVQNLDV